MPEIGRKIKRFASKIKFSFFSFDSIHLLLEIRQRSEATKIWNCKFSSSHSQCFSYYLHLSNVLQCAINNSLRRSRSVRSAHLAEAIERANSRAKGGDERRKEVQIKRIFGSER